MLGDAAGGDLIAGDVFALLSLAEGASAVGAGLFSFVTHGKP
jgi:hypothetical protein